MEAGQGIYHLFIEDVPLYEKAVERNKTEGGWGNGRECLLAQQAGFYPWKTPFS